MATPLLRFRRLRLRQMAEEECYARLHGDREGMVKIVRLPPRRPRYAGLVRGEKMRQLFEEKLDSRDQAEAG